MFSSILFPSAWHDHQRVVNVCYLMASLPSCSHNACSLCLESVLAPQHLAPTAGCMLLVNSPLGPEYLNVPGVFVA